LRASQPTDAGTAKLEVSVREDLVFAVREALFDVTGFGLAPFSLPALAEVELIAEKVRAVVQRAQPRDLFDLNLYLVESGWHLDPTDVRAAVDAKLSITRHARWKAGLWRINLDEIRQQYETTMASWIDPAILPPLDDLIRNVARRLRELGLD
jgi:predicted nucleotidyltransferase component of viral defense system